MRFLSDPQRTSLCTWEVGYDNIELPISVLGAAALDVVLALAETAEDQQVALDPVLAKMEHTLNSGHPLSRLITGSYRE